MSENLKTPADDDIVLPVGSLSSGSSSDSSIARRRMLLTSLGKGSAVAAAVAVPMQSLAAIGTLSVTADGKRCTISGTMSSVHSKETTVAICSGWSPGYYHKINHWPKYNASTNPTASNAVNGGSGTFNSTTSFSVLFGGGLSQGLLDILNNNQNNEAFHWIAALLNGTTGSPAINFPYTAQQVIDLYKAGGTTRSNALAFFKNYMETHVS